MRGESMKGKSKKSTYSTTFGVDPNNRGLPQENETDTTNGLRLSKLRKLQIESPHGMRGESMKGNLKNQPIPQPLVLTQKINLFHNLWC